MNEDQLARDGQYRKNFSIAFFNANNSALEMIKFQNINNLTPICSKDLQDGLKYWRNWMLEEYKQYYLTNLSGVGKPYSVIETVERLRATKTRKDLHVAWVSITEPERQDPDIRSVFDQLLSKYHHENTLIQTANEGVASAQDGSFNGKRAKKPSRNTKSK